MKIKELRDFLDDFMKINELALIFTAEGRHGVELRPFPPSGELR